MRLRRARVLAALCTAGLLAGCATPRPPAPAPEPTPPDVGAARPAPVDFARLRTGYGDRADFEAVCERNRPVSRLVEFVNRRQWDAVLAASGPWLAACPVDIEAHLMAHVAAKELGRDDEARERLRWYRGLVDSILASGDGRTSTTAFVVISVAEEYSVLRALRLRHTQQALMDGGIDMFSVVAEDGTRSRIYFNPAAHFRRLKRMLSPSPK